MEFHGRPTVFTATYNEIANISEWRNRTRRAVPEALILVVDDDSPDGTGALLDQIADLDGNMKVIHRTRKAGLGSAHKLAYQFAFESKSEMLITMDADLSHQPEELGEFIRAIRAGADFVVGSRWNGGSCDYSGFRLIVSNVGNWLARMLVPSGVSEFTTSFRGFSPKSLSALCDSPPPDDGYAFFMEVVVFLHDQGLRMKEVPIHFLDRTKGKSKIPRNQILVSALALLRLCWTRLRSRGRK